jgi:lysosomal acid lipase/cholesteryl ester hydrolase
MKKGAPVVFLQHGLFSSSETWCVRGKESFAYQLAEAGYDVWLGNNRGTRYSRKNKYINPDDDTAKFFDYSFYELGEFDAPAQIDFVLKKTGKSKLAYIGHSQGTSQMFAALSYNFGNLQNKLNSFTALAPIVHLGHTADDSIKNGSKYWRQFLPVAHALNLYEIRNPAVDSGMISFCQTFSSFCNGISNFFHMEGSPYNDKQAEYVEDKRPDSSGSLKQLVHYGQNAQTNIFKQYDYGSDAENIKYYGTKNVPVIPLNKIKNVPIGMFVGKNDPLGDPTDDEQVRKMVPTVDHYQEYKNWDHYSFHVSKDMSYVSDVITYLKKHGNTP